MAGERGYYEGYSGVIKIKDLEEKQNILRDRILLIGQNLVDMKEDDNKKIIEIKKDLENLKEDMRRIRAFIELVSSELSKFARREDLDVLTKQAKMFQPLEFVRKSELKRFLKE